jgi:hypothetical protein
LRCGWFDVGVGVIWEGNVVGEIMGVGGVETLRMDGVAEIFWVMRTPTTVGGL